MIRASLVATPIVLACLLLAAPPIGFRPFLTGLAHCALALLLLTIWAVGAFGYAVDCGGSSEPRECARVATLGLAAVILLFAQLLFGFGSLPLDWPFMRWMRRSGLIVAALGMLLPVYGCYGPAETFLPPAASR